MEARGRTSVTSSAATNGFNPTNSSDDHEEIVMTPLKSKSASANIIRVERVKQKTLQEEDQKVQYIAEGPNKGIIVKKATTVRPYKSEPDSLRRFTAYVQKNDTSTKEIREIRFWFKPEANVQAEDVSTSFFRELIKPTNFPKDYLQFVKKVLMLVQKYSEIRFIELEIRPYRIADRPIDVRGSRIMSDEVGATGSMPRLRKTTSVVEPPRHRSTGSVGDISNLTRDRRKTVSSVANERDNAVPTVFVYDNSNNSRAAPAATSPSAHPATSPFAHPAAGRSLSGAVVDNTEKNPRKSKKLKDKKFGDTETTIETEGGSMSRSQPMTELNLIGGGGATNGTENTKQYEPLSRQQTIQVPAENGKISSTKKTKKERKTSVPILANENGGVEGVEEVLVRMQAVQVTGNLGSPTYSRMLEENTDDNKAANQGKDRLPSRTSIRSRTSEVVVTEKVTKHVTSSVSSNHIISTSETTSAQATQPPSGERKRSTKRPKSSQDMTDSVFLPGTPSTPAPITFSAVQVAPSVERRRTSSKHSENLRSKPVNSAILNLLEDAYPSTLSFEDLTTSSGFDKPEVERSLAELRSDGAVDEVDTGFWVRSQNRKKLSSKASSNSLASMSSSTHRNDFRMIQNTPAFTADEQPSIAIITLLYNEKMAVDAMMDIKKTYVQHKPKGEGQIYTVGMMDRHRVLSTKLPVIPGKTKSTKAIVNAITKMFEAFDKVEHVLLVGVAGGVACYEDDSRHVRRGDAVISMAESAKSPFYHHLMESKSKDSLQNTIEARSWSAKDDTLRKIASKLKRGPKKLWRAMDFYAKEGLSELEGSGKNFHRPPPDSDRLYRTISKHEYEVDHPPVLPGSQREIRSGFPLVHFGTSAGGKVLSRDDATRSDFSVQHQVKAVDSGRYREVIDLLEARAIRSVMIVHGIADYTDGIKYKEWQAYAALMAAAVAKCIVVKIVLPDEEEEDGVHGSVV